MRAARAALVVISALLVSIMAYAIVMRVAYPFELEWMEGEMAVHVARLLRAEPLYTRPTISFVPFAYPPLYYYASCSLAWFMDAGLLPLRIVSIAATVITLLTIVAIVRPVSGWIAAAAACAAFAGAYAASDGWYDLGRVDSLYVALLALCYLAAVRATSGRHWALAGTLAALAFMTKQPALIAVVPFAASLLVFDRRGALWFCATFGVLAVSAVLLIAILTDGWYWYYVFDVPRLRLGVSAGSGRILSFWTSDLMPFALAVLGGFAVVMRRREWRHAALLAGLIVSAWLSRLEGGAWINTVMPAYLAAAILLGLMLRPNESAPLARHGLAIVQLVVLLYDPRPFIPRAQQSVEGEMFLHSLHSMRTPVLVLDHGYWSTQAGLPESAHGWAITDVVWADRGETGRALESEIRDAITQQRFATIVLDDERSWFFKDIDQHYRRTGEIIAPAPLSGAARRPRFVYER
jgi:hypothetical protein